MTINIHLDGSRLWIDPPLPVLADGTANKVRFRLSPDSDWDGLTITVIFRRVYAIGVDTRKIVISDVDAAYAVPHEVLHDGWLYIGAVGVSQNGEVRLTTAKMESPLKVSESEDGDADWAGSITPEVADQILALMGVMSNLNTTDKSSLVAAINEVLGKFGELDAADIAANVDGIPAGNVAVALAYLLDIFNRLDDTQIRATLDGTDVATVRDALTYLQDLAKQYVVNMTKNADGTYTADKTFDALKAAHDAGNTVICSFRDLTRQWDGPVRLPLVYLGNTYMGFAAVVDQEQGNMVYLWAYINSGGMGHTATEIATNDGSLVHYTAENKTDAQKTQARANIGAEAAPVELTWNQETHPAVLDFLRTIEIPGRYTFADDYGKYLYTLIRAYGGGLYEWYGILISFSGEETSIETKVYTGNDVGVLSPEDYYTPITRGALNNRVPETTAADAGKVLTVGAGGFPAWTAVVNAEEVAV